LKNYCSGRESKKLLIHEHQKSEEEEEDEMKEKAL